MTKSMKTLVSIIAAILFTAMCDTLAFSDNDGPASESRIDAVPGFPGAQGFIANTPIGERFAAQGIDAASGSRQADDVVPRPRSDLCTSIPRYVMLVFFMTGFLSYAALSPLSVITRDSQADWLSCSTNSGPVDPFGLRLNIV